LVLPLTGATVVMIQSGWAASYNQMDNLVVPLATVCIANVIHMLRSNHRNASIHLTKGTEQNHPSKGILNPERVGKPNCQSG